MLKVLEGNYADKPKRGGRKEAEPHWLDEYKGVPKFKPKTAADDDEIRARAEELKNKINN